MLDISLCENLQKFFESHERRMQTLVCIFSVSCPNEAFKRKLHALAPSLCIRHILYVALGGNADNAHKISRTSCRRHSLVVVCSYLSRYALKTKLFAMRGVDVVPLCCHFRHIFRRAKNGIVVFDLDYRFRRSLLKTQNC